MSENKRQFERCTVINYKSQDTAARYLRYCGIFNEHLLQIHCWVCSGHCPAERWRTRQISDVWQEI